MNRTQLSGIDTRSFKKKFLNSSAFYFFFLFAVSLFVSGCSTSLSSIYDFDYPLTAAIAKSNSSQLQIQIPRGWIIAEDNAYKTSDIWLVKEDYSATIKFEKVSLDEETIKSFSENELGKIAELNKTLVKAKFGKTFGGFTNEEIFGNTARTFSAYQYSDDKGQQIRTVLFKNNSQFYEVTAFALKSANPAEIFKAQNSMLASVK
jgi:hypothetical protein